MDTKRIEIVNDNIMEEIEKITSGVYKDEKITITLDIRIPTYLFNVNFRQNLINLIKKTYESRVYYMVYIENIDYVPINENELPLIKQQCDTYLLSIPLDVDIIYFKKGDIVSLKLVLNNNIAENKINVFGENTYISCKINLNNNQMIEAVQEKVVSVRDKTYNKVYQRGDNIRVKIIKFLNNQLHNGFTPRINCEGILI